MASVQTVKSCGKDHPWCKVCRPEQAKAQRRAKRPQKDLVRSCRNCGRCDNCIGLIAPEGMKVCRKCSETKLIAAFASRRDTGGKRNECMECRNSRMNSKRCGDCGEWFVTHMPERTLCARCRPPLTKPCARCGAPFVGTMDQRRYCSKACRQLTVVEQRIAGRLKMRAAILHAYGGEHPACACCGESQPLLLALDHINGGGHQQRQERGGGGFYTWLKRNNYPPGFQVLCHNCNMGRQLNGGICPHRA